MSTHRLIAGFLAVFIMPLMIGCTVSPRPVIRVHALDSEGVWVQGQHFVSTSAEDVDMVVGFNHEGQGQLVFDVEIRNRQDEVVLVDPTRFELVLLNPEGELPTSMDSRTALDPEVRLLAIDRRESRQIAADQGARNTSLLFSLLDATASVATMGQERTEEQEYEKEQLDFELETLEIERQDRHANELWVNDEDRWRWSRLALRKTTLGPGDLAGGQVIFRLPPQGEHLLLRAEVAGRWLEVRFLIDRIEAKSTRPGSPTTDDGQFL